MDFPHHEIQGHAECPKCRARNRSEFRVQDARGNRIGKAVLVRSCDCPGATPGETMRSQDCSCARCNWSLSA
jgi:hypothetical protein